MFVVAYAQEPAKTRSIGELPGGECQPATFTQGMAWIDAESYQIVRLTSDLLRPVPLVRLNKETTEIAFSEVKFKKCRRNSGCRLR